MRFILALLILSACSPLRHYQHVVNDTFRNSDERTLLARAYLEEFPTHTDTPSVSVDVDSSNYTLWLENEALHLMDSINHILPITDTSYKTVTRFVSLPPPPPIIKTTTVTNTKWDEGRLQEKDAALNQCRNENTIKDKELIAAKAWKGRFFWAAGILAALGIGGVITAIIKLKKI